MEDSAELKPKDSAIEFEVVELAELIRLVDATKLYNDLVVERYARLGTVVAEHTLAELHSLGQLCSIFTARAIEARERIEQLMKDLEKEINEAMKTKD